MRSFILCLKGKVILHIAAAIACVGLSYPSSAQTCTDHCLRVYSIELADLNIRVRGIVKLVDETGSGAGVRSSVVHVVWTRPDGTTLDQYDVIGTRLRAEFSLYTAGAPGAYTLTVDGATKQGYTFDPENSALLSDMISMSDNQDLDQDGVIDQLDNCILASNPDQTDADSDGFGNGCDADFNNDCIVNFADLAQFGDAFLTNDSITDLNSDGQVNFLDLIIVQASFLQPPGPTSTANICEL